MASDPEKRFERAMNLLFPGDRASPSPKTMVGASSAQNSAKVGESDGGIGTSPLQARKLSSSTKTPSPNSRPVCRPWDRADVLRRLATFKSMTWFGKPQIAGPVACARRGWINVDVDMLACEVCGAHLSFVSPPAPWSRAQADSAGECFAEQLESGHKALCAWKGNACSESLHLFPPSPPEILVAEYRDRSERLLQLSALPVISGSAMEAFRVGRGPQIESLLAQELPPLVNGFQYVHERQASGAESGNRSENGHGYESFYHSQRLIAVCGWEMRVLPYTVDSMDGPAALSKVSQHGEPGDAVVSRRSRELGPSVLMDSKSHHVEEKPDAGSERVAKFDPASVVLDCSLCRASVGLWVFSTVSRPPASAEGPNPGDDVPASPPSKVPQAQIGGGSTSSAPEKQASTGKGIANHGDDVQGTPVRVGKSPGPGGLNLSLTIAGGPPPTLLSSPAMVPPAFGPIPEFLPRLGHVEGSEVGDFVASYESRGSREHVWGSTMDTVSDRLVPVDSIAEGTVVDRDADETDTGKAGDSLKLRRSTENSVADQLSQGDVALASGNADVITEADTEVPRARPKRRRIEMNMQAGGTSARLSRHGLRDILPCSSSVNAVDTHYLHKQENSMESVENQFQESDGQETAVSAENEVNGEAEGTETVGQTQNNHLREAGSGRSVQQVQPSTSKSDEAEFADDGGETNVAVISTGTGVGGGASVGMGDGGSIGTQASHEVEMQGEVNEAEASAYVQEDERIIGEGDLVPEVIESQGLVAEFVPVSLDGGVGTNDARGDSDEVMLAVGPSDVQQTRGKGKSSVQSESRRSRGKRSYDECDDQTVDTTKAVILHEDSGQEEKEATTDGHTAALAGGEEDEHGCTTVNGPRRGVEEFRIWDSEKGEFDPIRQHRHFCPWVNGHVAARAKNGSSSACGWQLTVDGLYAYQHGDLPSQLAKSESVASYKPSSAASGGRLIDAQLGPYRHLGRKSLFG